MADVDLPILLKVPEVARRLGIARSLVYEMARDGRLPVVRFGKSVRVPRRGLEEWVEEQTRLALDDRQPSA